MQAISRARWKRGAMEKRKKLGAIVAKSVTRLNIECLRKKLAEESDEAKRQILSRLLREEEARLAELTNPATNGRYHVIGSK
jgi:hypothetical protein